MGRSHVSPIIQKYEEDCGPAAIKHALAVLGKRRSLSYLYDVCKTTRNGTSTKNMIRAITKLGYPVMSVQNADLRHVISALRYPPTAPRAVIVSYLYDSSYQEDDWKESGHWATVSSYRSGSGRIVLFDSYTGHKKSYPWSEFRPLWKDFDLIRTRTGKRKKHYELKRKWFHRLLLIVARDETGLPSFRQKTVRVYSP